MAKAVKARPKATGQSGGKEGRPSRTEAETAVRTLIDACQKIAPQLGK